MSYQNFLGYAGDILAVDAYALLRGDSTSVLIDVRTQAEWTYVGAPDIQALGKTPLFFSSTMDSRARVSDKARCGGDISSDGGVLA